MLYILESLRQLVIKRANYCCEYCLMLQVNRLFRHHIDHIIAEKHRGLTVGDNLCLCCPKCNRRKGSDIASIDEETGQIVPLFHPRRDKWEDHFRLEGARIIAITPVGRVTEFLLQFNTPDRLAERAALLKVGRYPCKP